MLQGPRPATHFSSPKKCTLRGHLVTHEFLYIPECPVALMVRDLLSKLQAQINFQENGQRL
jgi:hypothetical protein